MPIFFIVVGSLLIASGVNGKSSDLISLVKGDLVPSSSNNGGFALWAVAIFVIGALGYVKPLKPIANSFLVLVVLVLLITKGNPNSPGGGFIAQFNNAIKGNSNV